MANAEEWRKRIEGFDALADLGYEIAQRGMNEGV